MSWIFLTIFANFLSALVSMTDKHIVSNTKLKPISYTFYSGIFQVLYILIIPILGFRTPDLKLLLLGILIGALFIFTLLVFYKALRIGEASRVVPTVGAAVPIFTASLAYIILGEQLTNWQFISFVFLVLGGILISSKFSKGKMIAIKGVLIAILAGFLFALYYTLMKLLYLNVGFIDGFLLIQIGGFIGSSLLLLSKNNRKEIFNVPSTIKKGTTRLILPAKLVAAFAALILNYAISIEGSKITVINALQSVQYGFLLFLAILLSKKIPSLFHEQLSKSIITQKVISIVLISIGLYFLTF
jgi:uncharacterized membrane protein